MFSVNYGWRQPPVLGELLAGIALGNLLPLFGGVKGGDVRLEVDLRALVRVGASSSLVAVIGIVVPMGLGWSAALWLLPESPLVEHLFVGATLSATSVGITARVMNFHRYPPLREEDTASRAVLTMQY